MKGLLMAELLKLRTTRTTFGLAGAMAGLVSLLVVVHALALPSDDATFNTEMHVFGWGQLGALFSALLGALSITGEIRSGTIRPTFLATPDRRRVLFAKLAVCTAAGVVLGATAAGLTIGLGSAALAVRGMPIQLDGQDFAQLAAGSVLAAALWAPVGLGLGAIVRSQIGILIGLCVWVLFVENVLLGVLAEAVRFFPGAAAGAISGATLTGEMPSDPALLSPVLGGLLLLAYASAVMMAGVFATARRDVP